MRLSHLSPTRVLPGRVDSPALRYYMMGIYGGNDAIRDMDRSPWRLALGDLAGYICKEQKPRDSYAPPTCASPFHTE